MTSRLIRISITILTLLLCSLITFVFFDNSDRNEWFSAAVLIYYAIGLSILYLALLTIIGFTIKKIRNNETGKTILKTTSISFLLLLFTLTVTSIKSNRDYNNWKKETEQAEMTNKEFEFQLYQRKLDSLDNENSNSPNYYLTLIQRGLLKRRNGQIEESISDYKLAIKLKPNDFNANLEMGYSLELLDKKEEAEKYYRIAANIDTNSYFSKTNRQYIKKKK
jgi:tetratricopeptide (TPR) repeat protein